MAANIPRDRVFWAVALGHMTNDIFMASGPLLLTFIGGVYFAIPPAYIGIAISAREMLGALSQPLFGWLSDKGNSRLLGAGGVAFTVTMLAFSMFLAMVGNFWLMILPFALSALGSGAFHPVGTAFASHKNKAAASTTTAYFFLFGQLGLALGPAVVGFLLGLTQTNGEGGSVFPVFILALASLPSVLFMSVAIPRHGEVMTPDKADPPADGKPAPRAVKVVPLAILAVIVVLRGMASPGSVAFIPALFEQKGWSPAAYGQAASLYWIGSAMAGVLLGAMADRFGRRRLVMSSLFFAAPVFVVLPLTNGVLAYVMSLLAGAMSGGAHSILVVLAQSLLPGRKGFASGVALGFIFGAGALGTLAIGYMADGIFSFAGVGLVRAFQWIGVFTAAAGLLAYLLPAPGQSTTEPPVADAQLGTEGAD